MKNSVLIMDNVLFYYTEQIEQICRDAGVILVHLPLYLLDLNLIEEFFAELKALLNSAGKYMRINWGRGLIPSWNGVLTW